MKQKKNRCYYQEKSHLSLTNSALIESCSLFLLSFPLWEGFDWWEKEMGRRYEEAPQQTVVAFFVSHWPSLKRFLFLEFPFSLSPVSASLETGFSFYLKQKYGVWLYCAAYGHIKTKNSAMLQYTCRSGKFCYCIGGAF